MIICYLCGRKIKEAEVIPGQDKQICDICEARLEFEWNQAGKSKGLLLRRSKLSKWDIKKVCSNSSMLI